MKAILLDIEGTTTPIDFVHKTLFPFAYKRITNFAQTNFASIQGEIASLRLEHHNDLASGKFPPPFDESSVESVARYLLYLMDKDRKSTALKSIQGKIWRAGYESGELRGDVFDDVPAAFERWRTAGKTIAIFSSGSILAQKLIFGFSTAGDLTEYISNYFDTTTGAKGEPESYQKIADALELPPPEILFLSDSVSELAAAFAAGMNGKLSIRPNNPPPESLSQFESFSSFEEIE